MFGIYFPHLGMSVRETSISHYKYKFMWLRPVEIVLPLGGVRFADTLEPGTEVTVRTSPIVHMSVIRFQVRYANLSEELQITQHRIDEAQEASDAKVNMLNIEVDHFKAENEKLLTQLEDIKQEKLKNLPQYMVFIIGTILNGS